MPNRVICRKTGQRVANDCHLTTDKNIKYYRFFDISQGKERKVAKACFDESYRIERVDYD